MHMGSGPDVFPGWLRYVWVSAFCCIIIIHLRHAAVSQGACRWWHAGHAFMALGMVSMYLSMKPRPLPALAWEASYILLTMVIAAWITLMLSRRRALSLLWFNLMIGMAGMFYMFIMPHAGRPAWSYLFITYFLAEAIAWAFGALDDGKSAEAPRLIIGSPRLMRNETDILVGRTTFMIRGSLAVMTTGMAYMILGMQLAR
jgi:hypothetical protein